MSLPILTLPDPKVTGEGVLDPLGLSTIGDRLADHVLPGLRARMSRPRFLTAMAVCAAVCDGIEDRVADDGVTQSHVVFEWLVVEGFVRSAKREDTIRTPGMHIRPQRRARTRDAIAEVRHVFLDADRDGAAVLAAISRRRDLPPPSYVTHSSSNRLHVLWQVSDFTKDDVEALQNRLAVELGTDKAATSCAQVTRLPGYFNHKYRPASIVLTEFAAAPRCRCPSGFPSTSPPVPVEARRRSPAPASSVSAQERARRYIAAIPPAVAGQHGDAATFRVCCRLVRGFDLEDAAALAVLADWNRACEPPWSESELRTKLAAARAYGKEQVGGLLNTRSLRHR